MKTNKLLSAFVYFSFATILFSCKKQDVATSLAEPEYETTFELSGNQAIADNLTEDANTIFVEAAAKNNLLNSIGSNLQIQTNNNISCAVVTVTPANGFPKNIVIDFGTGNCTSANGITRKGKINILLTDFVRNAGSKAEITFTNYYVNNFKKEGAITYTNTSTPSTPSWQIKIANGKIVAPTGRFWLHNGLRNVVQIDGSSTPATLLDDVFLITGNHTVTNAAGKTRDCFITQALKKKTTCDNICEGKLKVQGANLTALIDFGIGDCDKLATIYIDGQTPRTIALR
jgi:hypothetical protein